MHCKHERCKALFGIAQTMQFKAIAILFFYISGFTFAQIHAQGSILGAGAKLDSIKAELDRGRSRLHELEQQEGSQTDQLEQINRDLDASQDFLAIMGNKVDAAAAEKAHLADSLDAAKHRLSGRQDAMKRRLRAMYKVGNPDLFELLVTAHGLADMIQRFQYFKALARYDHIQLGLVRKTRDEVSLKAAAAERQEKILVGLKTAKEQEQDQLKGEQSRQATILEGVRNEKAAYVARVKELEAAGREMGVLIKKLQAKAAAEAAAEKKRARQANRPSHPTAQNVPSGAFGARHGLLPWPIDGPILKKYGRIVHPVYQTVTMNSGIDIGGEKGSRVNAVAPGMIEYVGTMRGYGTFAIVDHGGGYCTIYAQLGRVTVEQGASVSAGSQIGTIGTPEAAEDKPALEFQIRKESETLDPMDWLRNR